MKKQLFVLLQHLLPHHLISRLAHCLADCKVPFIKKALIQTAIKYFDVDMSEAKNENPESYEHFNAFFTRALKADTRPLPEDPEAIVSPADGAISQIGDIANGRLFQAKGHDYSLMELLGGDLELSQSFMGGKFATIYLSPRDYHRVHMPCRGTLRKMIHVPGRLFSVNQNTVESVNNLFARNERVVSIFDTNHGPMAVIMVGAMIVASIETVWSGLVTPVRRKVRTFDYGGQSSQEITLGRGEEMGRFKMGSTAIVLFGKEQIDWLDEWESEASVKLGQVMADRSQ